MPPVPPPPPTDGEDPPPPPPPGPPPGFAPVPAMVPVMVPVMVPMQPRAVMAPPPAMMQLPRRVNAAPPVPRAPPPRDRAAAAHTIGAAPTVKKQLPAHHNPALKALVPASVKIQRDREAVPPSKRQRVLITAPLKQAGSDEPKKEDDKYLDFLDSVRDLGAFE